MNLKNSHLGRICLCSIKDTLFIDDIEDNRKEIIILQANLANNKEAIEKNDENIGTLSDKAASFKTDIDNNKDDIKAIESAVNQNSENFGRNDEDIANLEKIVSNNTKGQSMSLLNNLTIKFSNQIPILIIQEFFTDQVGQYFIWLKQVLLQRKNNFSH